MKKWNNPELKNLNVEYTQEEGQCPEADGARCWCEYYHWKVIHGNVWHKLAGCSAPGFKCVRDGHTPILLAPCTCNESGGSGEVTGS